MVFFFFFFFISNKMAWLTTRSPQNEWNMKKKNKKKKKKRKKWCLKCIEEGNILLKANREKVIEQSFSFVYHATPQINQFKFHPYHIFTPNMSKIEVRFCLFHMHISHRFSHLKSARQTIFSTWCWTIPYSFKPFHSFFILFNDLLIQAYMN